MEHCRLTSILFNLQDGNGEFVELFNNGNVAVDISGWEIVDKASNTKTLSGTTLQPGDYYIVARTTNGCGGLAADETMGVSLNNKNEIVTLRDASGATVDSHSYSSSPNNKSIVRDADANGNPLDTWSTGPTRGNPRGGYVNNSGAVSTSAPTPSPTFSPTTSAPTRDPTFPPTSAPTRAPSTPAPVPATSASSVVISEIMYNPSACSDSTGEWLELYNTGASAVDVAGWTLSDASGTTNTLSSFSLPAGGYMIVGRTTVLCNEGYSADDTMSFALNNSGGDTITLKDNSGAVVDVVTYTDSAAAGNSLELQSDGTWAEGPSGGTPRANGPAPAVGVMMITEIMANPGGSCSVCGSSSIPCG